MPEGEAAASGTAADQSRGVVAHLVRSNKRLELDNKKLRDRLKEAKTQAETAKPVDGAIVLTADEAKRWETLKKLEGEPADIAKRLESGKAAEAKLAEHEKKELARKAVTAVGWKEADVLTDLLQSKKLDLEMMDAQVEEGGKKVTKKLPHLRPAGDDKAPWKVLTDFVQESHPAYVSALKGSATEEGAKVTGGPSWPPQRGGEKPIPPSDRAAAFIENRQKASALDKSPLAKAAGLK